ncbi:hypothetical protein EDB86DRAFT_3078977 [Lactarius hatsudake]|nr:hypothetical protein EDB86DRAFT_3078977 [Lactarius hatsudake]
MTGIKDSLRSAVGSAVGSVTSVNDKAENSGSALLDRLGDKVLGPTAESGTNDAPVIAPDATVTPDTQGRRSRHPEGHDPFRGDEAPAPADEP